MYGRTGYNPLSQFVREELPEHLVTHDAPRKVPPRVPNYGRDNYGRQRTGYQQRPDRELNRPIDIFVPKKKEGAEGFGVEKLSAGTRVEHAIFGKGTVKSARDMGGDILYEVSFDSGSEKKLMATFAKLKKI